MSLEAVDRIARAVLYEGYMLYPYRSSSVKNRQRWNFGVLMPVDFRDSGERSTARTEVVYHGPAGSVQVRLRFLQQETEHVFEREVVCRSEGRHPFQFGVLEGTVEVTAGGGRVAVEIENLSVSGASTREQAIPFALLSAHVVLLAGEGKFVSSLDPPESEQRDVAACRNEGLYPVLVEDDCMLASPIILYDRPQIAAESAGDLFDGTEIDEILSLRILTLSDEEKEQIRRGDERVRRLLERTESLDREQWAKLHGTMRSLRE